MQSLGLHLLLLNILSCAIMLQLQELQKHIFCLLYIGLQVGPGFFSSFRKGGITLNKLAVLVVALGVVTTVALYYVTGLPMTTMVGVMSGAVTNTPGLGAAQQAFSDLHAGADAPDIATGYALAYPLGVIGAILTLLALRYLLRIDVRQEEEAAGLGTDVLKDLTTRQMI